MTHATETLNGRARRTLVMAMDLGRGQWRLGFAIGAGLRPRSRTIRGDEWRRLGDEIAAAKARFGVPVDTRVVSCYEAGPDGFLIHRYLTTLGVESLVVDPASIEVNRRGRQAKTDRLDVERLLALLLRYVNGETAALRVVRCPASRAPAAAPPRVPDHDWGPRARPESHERLARDAGAARTRAV